MKQASERLSMARNGLIASAKFLIPAICLAGSLAQGATTYTLGATDLNWNNNGSWTPSGYPGSGGAGTGDTASIGSSRTITVTVSQTVGILSITGGTITGAGGVTLTVDSGTASSVSAGAFNLSGGMTIARTGGSFSLSSTSTGMAFANSSIWDQSGGAFSLSGNNGKAISGTGQLKTSGASGSFAINHGADVTSTIASGVDFILASSAATALTVARGTLQVSSGTAEVTGTVSYTGATTAGIFQYTGAGTLTVGKSGGQFNLTQPTGNAGDAFTFAPSTSAAQLKFDGTGNMNWVLDVGVTRGTITGTASSTASGSGMLNISASAGTVSIEPGTAGTIGTLNLGARGLNVASAANTVTLSIDVLNNTADKFQFGNFSGSGADLSKITLSVNDLGGNNVASPLTILTSTSTLTTFEFAGGLGDGDTIAGMTLHINANDVTLTPVPEPVHYAGAVGIGLVGFAALRRQRANRKA